MRLYFLNSNIFKYFSYIMQVSLIKIINLAYIMPNILKSKLQLYCLETKNQYKQIEKF